MRQIADFLVQDHPGLVKSKKKEGRGWELRPSFVNKKNEFHVVTTHEQ